MVAKIKGFAKRHGMAFGVGFLAGVLLGQYPSFSKKAHEELSKLGVVL